MKHINHTGKVITTLLSAFRWRDTYSSDKYPDCFWRRRGFLDYQPLRYLELTARGGTGFLKMATMAVLNSVHIRFLSEA